MNETENKKMEILMPKTGVKGALALVALRTAHREIPGKAFVHPGEPLGSLAGSSRGHDRALSRLPASVVQATV
jgi:hypothetical protein